MTTKLDLPPASLLQLQAYMTAEPAIMRAWAIGSRARGRARPDSDLDLTLELAPDDEQLSVLIDNVDRWKAEMTIAAGVVVKDFWLETDPKDSKYNRGRRCGILIFSRIN